MASIASAPPRQTAGIGVTKPPRLQTAIAVKLPPEASPTANEPRATPRDVECRHTGDVSMPALLWLQGDPDNEYPPTIASPAHNGTASRPLPATIERKRNAPPTAPATVSGTRG